LALVWSY